MQEQDFSINLLLGHVLTVITHVHFTVLMEDTVISSVDMSTLPKTTAGFLQDINAKNKHAITIK